jgi:hypothetical protein
MAFESSLTPRRKAPAAEGGATNAELGEVEGALVLEKLEVADDVGLYFRGVGLGVKSLEFGDDLVNGVLAVATLDDFQARAVQAEGAFGHQEDLLVVVLAQADACG